LPLLLVRSAEGLWIVYAAAFVQATVGQFFAPAETALLPKLVGEEHLVSANALNELNNNLARLIGPALGGLVTAVAGLGGVVIADIASFAIAASLIAAINVTSQVNGKAKEVGAPSAAWRKVWTEWLDGLRVIRRERIVLVLFVAFTITGLGEGIISTLFVPFVKDVMHGEALQLGWLMSAQAVGGLIGGIVIGWIGARVLPYKLAGVGAVLFGFIDLMIFNYPLFIPGVELGLILFVLVGLPTAGMGAGFSTLVQSNVADEYMGRVSGALGTSFALMTLLGIGLAGVLGEIIAVLPLINVQGIVYIAAGVIVLILLSPQKVKVQQPLESAAAVD
jgi:MFS family permease